MSKELFFQVGIALIAAILISFLSTPLVRVFAGKVGAIDVPDEKRRVHDHPIPRLGGLAIFLGFVISVLLFGKIDKQIQGILLGAVVIVVVGVIDDIVPLPALVKFVLQIAAAIIAVAHGVEIKIISNPNVFSASQYLFFGKLAAPITVFWIVAITNSVNLIDGLDGLAVGVSTIATVTMLIIALIVAEANVAIILAALAGACIGFMPYNLNPAKIFMGDTGALLLGFVLATMSVIGLFKFYAIISFAVPFIVLGLPIFDTASAFIRRLSHGESPMKPDRKHFHHRLIDMGLSQKQAVAILYVISTVLGIIAVVITTRGSARALLVLLAILIAAGMAFFLMRSRRSDVSKMESDDTFGKTDSDEKPVESVDCDIADVIECNDSVTEADNEH